MAALAALAYDVIVVGAGLSGLWAARELKKEGLSVLVLEGRDRVGGRSYTDLPGSENAIDYGAHWFGTSQYQIMSVVEELGKTRDLFKQYTTGKKILQVQGSFNAALNKIPFVDTPVPIRHYNSQLDWLPLFQQLNFIAFFGVTELNSMIDRSKPWDDPKAVKYDNMTADTYSSQPPWDLATTNLAKAMAHATFGKELSQFSALQFLAYVSQAGGLSPLIDAGEGGAQEWKLNGGTQQLSIQLAKGLDVKLNATVVSIGVTDGTATVTTLGGKAFQGKQVILAIPPKHASSLWYDPVLPAKKAMLLADMTMGNIMKAFLIYDTPFWREAGFSGEVVSSVFPVSICYDDTTPGGVATLMCFISGKSVATLETKTFAERQAIVTDAMVRYFGKKAKDVKEYKEFDWALEPFTGGCPVATANGGTITTYGDTIRESHGPIHFGATETATWWNGYMNGAVQAGARCAIEVLEALGKDVPGSMREFESWGGKKGPSDKKSFLDMNGRVNALRSLRGHHSDSDIASMLQSLPGHDLDESDITAMLQSQPAERRTHGAEVEL